MYHLVSEGYEVYPVTFNYGQKHSKEQAYAILNVTRIRILNITKDSIDDLAIKQHHVIDISSIQRLLKSALTSDGIDVPKVPETDKHYEMLKTTVVPNRNMIFLSIAAGYANSIGAHKVAYASLI